MHRRVGPPHLGDDRAAPTVTPVVAALELRFDVLRLLQDRPADLEAAAVREREPLRPAVRPAGLLLAENRVGAGGVVLGVLAGCEVTVAADHAGVDARLAVREQD